MSCFRLCVRDMVCSSEFLLTQALLSPTSSPIQCRSISALFGLFDWFSDTMACSDFPTPFIAAFDLTIFSARCGPPSCSAGGWDLPVSIPQASTHAEGLRPRRLPTTLAISTCGLLPSASLNSVGCAGLRISWLHTSPASSPVNASSHTLRLASHDGQNDWPGLFCATLPFATSCWFSGASNLRARESVETCARLRKRGQIQFNGYFDASGVCGRISAKKHRAATQD